MSGFAINNCCTLVCILHLATGFLFAAGIGRPSVTWCTLTRLSVTVYSARPTKHGLALYIHGRVWILCMTARLDVTQKTTEQNRIVRNDKFEVQLTIKKLHLRYCTIEAMKWTTDRYEAPRGLCATAELLVIAAYCTLRWDLIADNVYRQTGW